MARRAVVRIGTEIVYQDTTYVLDGQMPNRNPRGCYGCGCYNDGESVYVLKEKPQRGKQDGKKQFWCKDCVELHLDPFEAVVSAQYTAEGAF